MHAESGSGFDVGYRGCRQRGQWLSIISQCPVWLFRLSHRMRGRGNPGHRLGGNRMRRMLTDDGLALSPNQKCWLRLNRVLWTTLCGGRIWERLQWESSIASLCFCGAETSWGSSLALESGASLLNAQKLAAVRMVCWKESKFWVPVRHHVLWNATIPFVSFARF